MLPPLVLLKEKSTEIFTFRNKMQKHNYMAFVAEMQ